MKRIRIRPVSCDKVSLTTISALIDASIKRDIDDTLTPVYTQYSEDVDEDDTPLVPPPSLDPFAELAIDEDLLTDASVAELYQFKNTVLSFGVKKNGLKCSRVLVGKKKITPQLFFAILFKFTSDCDHKGGTVYINLKQLPEGVTQENFRASENPIIRYIRAKNFIFFENDGFN